MTSTTQFPAALRKRGQWVLTGPNKAPKIAGKNAPASSTDQDTWRSYLVAARAARANGHRPGFVFSPDDPFVGIDIDGCRDPTTGEIHPAAREIIDRLNTYAEVSPSGTGVHIIGLARVGRGRKIASMPWGGKLEVYDRGRYFTMTGDHVPGTPRGIKACQGRINAIARKWASNRQKAVRSDDRAVDKASRADPGHPPARHDESMGLAGGLWAKGLGRDKVLQKITEHDARREAPLADDPREGVRELERMVEWLQEEYATAEDEFWDSTPILRHIRRHARANRTVPLAVLGCTLARVSAAVSPAVQLPGLGDGRTPARSTCSSAWSANRARARTTRWSNRSRRSTWATTTRRR